MFCQVSVFFYGGDERYVEELCDGYPDDGSPVRACHLAGDYY